nr:glycosyltransferase family 4 protein [Acinetobacter sp. Marseille-Q1620]
MRITMVMASDEDGGLEKHVIELTNGLASTHEVSLIAHPRYQDLLDNNVNFISFDMSGSRYNPITKYKLNKKILDTKPDILHAHASKTAKLLQKLIPKFDFPSVVTIHGLKSNIQAYLAFDKIIAVSQRLAKEINRPEKVDVVYNGVKIKTLVKPFEKNRKFIAIGRLNEVKGFDILIHAWQGIPHQLLIVGNGEEQETLEQLIQSLNLTENVKLYGYSEHIHDQITEAEALIVSSHREGGPYTLSEALLLERPVIGTDVGMMSEFVPGEYLCITNNKEALHQLIEHYLKDDEIEQRFNKSFTLARQQLTFEKMLEHTLAVYQNTLK